MAKDFSWVFKSQSKNWQKSEKFDRFQGPKTAAPDYFDKFLLQNIGYFS